MLNQAHFLELKACCKLPSPKGAALKVMELCRRDNATLPEIIHVLQADPATVGRILKIANSATLNRPQAAAAITTDVLMSIGLNTVSQVVLAFSLVSETREGVCPDFDYDAFWSRAAATGAACQLLAAATRAAPPADMFTVGLLAGIGRLALAAVHPARYGTLLSEVHGQFDPALTGIEQEAFGYNHVDVAAAMMGDWGLPRLYTDAAQFHESPDHAGFDANSRSARVVGCVHLASRIVRACFHPGHGSTPDLVDIFSFAQLLGIHVDDVLTLGDQMLSEWRGWSELLGIALEEAVPLSELARAGKSAEGSTA